MIYDMKSNSLFLKRIFAGMLVMFSFFLFTQEAFAQATPPKKPEASKAFTLDLKIENPLKVNNIQEAIKLGLDFVMTIAIPIIIVLFIWSGFQFVFALGNKDKIVIAKRNFLYTLIGTLLVLGAWTIASAVISTVNSLTQ
jgi:hypothetical protein